jgi:hypothetical protein
LLDPKMAEIRSRYSQAAPAASRPANRSSVPPLLATGIGTGTRQTPLTQTAGAMHAGLHGGGGGELVPQTELISVAFWL